MISSILTNLYKSFFGMKNGNNRGFWNGTGLSVLQSTTAQANYLTNNENLVDYVDDTYVDIDYA